MMQTFKNAMTAEGGMQLVNLLFLISAVFRGSSILCLAYGCGMVYLICGIRRTTSRAAKIINACFLVFAAGMILINFAFLLRPAR